MKITVKSEEKVGSKNHSAKRFCSTVGISSRGCLRSAECLGWPIHIYKHLILKVLQTTVCRSAARYV